MRPTTLSLALITTLALAPHPASAAFTTFTDQASFLAAAGSPITTETFDEIPSNTTYMAGVFVTDSGFTFFVPPGSSIDADNSAFSGESPPNFLVPSVDRAGGITFGGGSSDALGFALSVPTFPPANAFPADYTATVTEADGTTTVVSLSYATGGTYYLGFVETGAMPPGIVEVFVSPIMSPAQSLFPVGLDDVSRGAVTAGNYPLVNPYATPEPASAILLGVGLAAVGLGVRWGAGSGRR